jgi:hypothetical protein
MDTEVTLQVGVAIGDITCNACYYMVYTGRLSMKVISVNFTGLFEIYAIN